MNTLRAGISLCMIVRNEEGFLAEALASVAGVVDEVCIVDTGSTDKTREIARAYGARVLDVRWRDDFAQARNAALSLATRRWIFVLDADERLAPESRDALAAIGQTPAGGRGKWIVCRNLTDNNKGSGAMTNALVRIFPNDPHLRYRNSIHEFVARNGCDAGLPADRTQIEIIHHGYLSAVVAARAKAERNLRLSRLALEREPTDAFHHYNLGMALLLAGQSAAAIEPLERARELTQRAPRGFRVHALVTLAGLYADERGDMLRAHELVSECLALVPNYSNAHYLHGRLLVLDGELFEARNAFGRAIAAGAHDSEQFVVDNEIAIWKAHSEIGATLMAERRFGQALGWFELGSRARPAAQPLVINRAKCYEALGDAAVAEALFASAFRMFADEPSAVEWINFLLRHERIDAALDAIEAALDLVDEPAQTLLLGIAAATHLRRGDCARAQIAIDRSVARGNRSCATAIIERLAVHLALPQLAQLLPVPLRARANALHIAYISGS